MKDLSNVDPTKWLMIPVSEFEFLRTQIRRLSEVVSGHCDTPVLEILSGSEPRWLCLGEISDLRESLNEMDYLKDKAWEITRLEHRVVDVPEAEQVEILKQWIKDGGL
jgi:hypothetical protein